MSKLLNIYGDKATGKSLYLLKLMNEISEDKIYFTNFTKRGAQEHLIKTFKLNTKHEKMKLEIPNTNIYDSILRIEELELLKLDEIEKHNWIALEFNFNITSVADKMILKNFLRGVPKGINVIVETQKKIPNFDEYILCSCSSDSDYLINGKTNNLNLYNMESKLLSQVFKKAKHDE